MTTITEDYVSFETAKLLKEKGFNEEVISYYDTGGQGYFISPRECNIGTGSVYAAPTIQMAMKWLREIHKTFISITYENDGVFTANLKVPLKGVDCMIDNKHNCWLTYEEAAEVAIRYCLQNLI